MESIKDLIGLTFENVIKKSSHGDDVIIFHTPNNDIYTLYHDQSCCESVTINEIKGDLDNLIGSPLLDATEENPDLPVLENYDESYTWTLYKFTTEKGSVEILWYGTSNGYYSESVNFCKAR